MLARLPVLLLYVNPVCSVRSQFILSQLPHRLAIDGAYVQLLKPHDREICHAMTVGINILGRGVTVSCSNMGEV